jgi:hypothetical protein
MIWNPLRSGIAQQQETLAKFRRGLPLLVYSQKPQGARVMATLAPLLLSKFPIPMLVRRALAFRRQTQRLQLSLKFRMSPIGSPPARRKKLIVVKNLSLRTLGGMPKTDLPSGLFTSALRRLIGISSRRSHFVGESAKQIQNRDRTVGHGISPLFTSLPHPMQRCQRSSRSLQQRQW